MQLKPGQHIGEYEILEVIGSGGFSVVYRAQDLNLLRPVAIKQLSPEAFSEAGSREWFLREARLAASLDHPNIVATYALREQGDDIFMVMEYLPHGDLHTLVIDKGALDRALFIRVAEDTCHALEALHAQGVIHRDIKPENILIAQDSKFKLADFGLAHIHRTRQRGLNSASGPQPGTIFYMSPEQATGARITLRSDIYSLGVVLYEAMTGHYYLPYHQDEDDEGRLQTLIVEAPPLPLRRFHSSVPEALGEPILRALSKDPAQRPASAREFLADLKRALSRSRHTTLSRAHRDLIGQPAPASPDLLRELYAIRTLRDADGQPEQAQQRLHAIWEEYQGVPEVAAEWGETLIALSNPTDGRDWLERAVRLRPHLPFAQLALADLYRDVFDEPEMAGDALIAAIHADADLVYAVLYDDIVDSLNDPDQYETFVALFQQAAAERPTPAIFHNLGQVLALHPARERASVAAFEQAIILDQQYGPAYVGLGSLLIELNRIPDAVALLEQAVRSSFPYLPPENWHKTATVYQPPHAFQALAVTYAQLGQFEKSALAARRVLEMAPQEMDADAPELLDVYVQVAHSWIVAGQYQRAYWFLDQIVPLARHWPKPEVFSLMESLSGDVDPKTWARRRPSNGRKGRLSGLGRSLLGGPGGGRKDETTVIAQRTK